MIIELKGDRCRPKITWEGVVLKGIQFLKSTQPCKKNMAEKDP